MKTFNWILGLVLVGVMGFAGCQSPENMQNSMELFYKANALYKSDDYAGASKVYDEIVRMGYSSAAVYYNIGNCAMKQNQIGRAILWYERALRLAPRDADIQANRAFAMSLIKNPQLQAKNDWAQRVFIHLNAVTREEIMWIIVGLVAGISLLIVGGLYGRWRFQKALILLGGLTVLLVFHVMAFVIKEDQEKNLGVILVTSEAKYEPEEKATTHYTVFEGWLLKGLKESSGWIKVERPDGLQGWIPQTHWEKID